MIYLVILFQLCVLNLPKMLFEIMPFVLLFSGLLWTIRIKSYKEKQALQKEKPGQQRRQRSFR